MANWDKIKDTELTAWLQAGGKGTREIVFQAQTPPRDITLQRRPGGRVMVSDIKSDTTSRNDAITGLSEALGHIGLEHPVILKSAGAVVGEVTGTQVIEILNHPLVKAIYPNRTLKTQI